MKIQELRIGNLVYLVYPDGITHKVEITGILPDKVFFKGKSSGFSMYEAISPIPLTEEILLKCGFEKDDTGVDMFDPDYAEWYQMEFPVIGILCQSSDKKYLFDENTDTLRIQYLHQLQNLYFALTGEELEVKL